ncbi:MAG TPA: glycosyltransferase [Candidatus Krumholzibacteria bacterium]|nr:glycosyltransferase [Candidatus Krumholzibacteria bacterium]
MTIRPAGTMPDVSIVIPVFNKLELTRTCVDSIHAHGADCTFEIIIVDNGSSDGTGAWLEAQEAAARVRAVANPDNLGFSRGCNLGASHARGRYVLFLNNDMEVLPGWLDPLVWTLDTDPDVGVVGARLLFPDGTIQHAGVAMIDYQDDRPPIMGGQHKSYRLPHDDPEVMRPQLMQVVTGACLLIRPEVFAAVGGFDEGYWNGNEDVDLCLMAGEAGWNVAYRPESAIIHYESQSGPERFARMVPNIERFNAKWRGRARPDFIKRQCRFQETPDIAIRLYAPPRQLHAGRRRGWSPAPQATVIVSCRGDAAATERMLQALLRHTDRRHAVVLLDDGADAVRTSLLMREAARHAHVQVMTGAGTAGVNEAMAVTGGDAVCILDGRAVVTPGWLDVLLRAIAAQPRAGLAGPRTNLPAVGQAIAGAPAADRPSRLESFAAGRSKREAGHTHPAAQLAGFCLAMRRAVVERAGGLDPHYAELDGAAIDLCLRATLAGFHSLVADGAYVAMPADAGTDTHPGDAARLLAKWPLGPGRDDDLKQLLDRGFLPPLHFEPLPPGPGVVDVPSAPWEAAAWTEAGEAAFAAGRHGEAVRLLRAAAAVLPDDPRTANDLAVALLELDPEGRGADLARGILRRVLTLDPRNADASWNLQQIEAGCR